MMLLSSISAMSSGPSGVRTKISYNSRFSLNAVLRKTSKGEYCHMRRYNETSGVRMNIEHAVNDSQATS